MKPINADATGKLAEIGNAHVRLIPIGLAHADEFAEIGDDASIWQHLPGEPLQNSNDAAVWIKAMLARADLAVTYSVFDRATGALAGTSSFIGLDEWHGSCEIGYTWYGRLFQRTHINTATKLAMLTQAFDELGATRVQLQTDARNTASQNAIARIGAVKEGCLRQHKKYPNGYVRDTVVFSIVADEWPTVQTQLQNMLSTAR